MAYDAGMLSFIVDEINRKLGGAKIEKIYQPQKDEIILTMKQGGDTLRLLINAGSSSPRMNITDMRPENPPTPPMFCMVLRKHLGGAKLISAVQLGFERAARLTFAAYDEMGFQTEKHLIVELMGKYSNLILSNAEDKMIGVMHSVDFTTSQLRQVLPGMTYELPPKQNKLDPTAVTEAEFKQLAALQDMDRRADKFITENFAGIAASVAREMAYRASGSITATLGECGNKLTSVFSDVVENIMSHRGTPTVIYGEDGVPVEYAFTDMTHYGAGFTRTAYDSFGEMIDIFFATRSRNDRLKQRAADVFKILTNAENRLIKKIDKQTAELEECDEGEKYKLWGDLITANIYRLSRGMKTAKLDNYYCEYEPVEIPLEERYTPSQNAQRYYKKYAKLKSARVHLGEQIELARSELQYVYTVLDSLTRADTEKELAEIRDELYHSGYASRMKNYTVKKNRTYAVVKFVTDGGYTVYCGKNNVANDYLTTKVAEKNDWWFHVKNQPGSHVVMALEGKGEPSETDFTQAASIAAYYSAAAGAPHTEVDYTLARHVKKPSGSKPGYVIYHTNWSATVSPDGREIERLRV